MSSVVETSLNRFLHSLRSVGMTTSVNMYIVPNFKLMIMKKILRNILLSALTITAVASCADDRNNFLPDDSFGFNNKAGENVLTLPLYGGSYEIDVIKSGKGMNEGVVSITTSNFDLKNYNDQYGVEYFPLPADQDRKR